jgi:transposase
VVERTVSWVKGLRRLRVRYDRSAVIRDAWTTVAASVICFRMLNDEHQLAA